MKKILVAVMAVMMTMGLMAQCPQQKIGCAAQQSETCQAKKECIKKDCIYSPETRAMMQVDRIVRIVKDLTGNERQQLLDFYKSHFINCEKRKEMANPTEFGGIRIAETVVPNDSHSCPVHRLYRTEKWSAPSRMCW